MLAVIVKNCSPTLHGPLSASIDLPSMLFAVWVPLVLQLLLPVALLLWLALARRASQAVWTLRVLLTVLFLGNLAVAGLWLVLPWYTPVAYAAGLLLAASISAHRLHEVPTWPSGWRGMVGLGVLVTAAVSCAVLLLQAERGRGTPAGAVVLSSPLASGTYLVVNGGHSELINAHLETLVGEHARAWRGQSYGVDMVKLGPSGLRAHGILPRDPGAYAIFGDPVYAPCAGQVVIAVDGIPDMHPPEMDARHMAGNHVILRCGAVWIVLGHLRQGSVGVQPGDSVDVMAPLGRVGNSGNTSEPHLHIHAQRSGASAAPMAGEPLPIRFGAIYPTRNLRIRTSGSF